MVYEYYFFFKIFSNHNKYGIQIYVIIKAQFYNFFFVFFLRVIIGGKTKISIQEGQN